MVRSIAIGAALCAMSVAAFAATTFKPVEIAHNHICPAGVGGGNDPGYPVMFATNGDEINYHYPKWWERWYSRGGIVIDRIELMDCKNFHISWRTERAQTFVIPAHSSISIPMEANLRTGEVKMGTPSRPVHDPR